MNKDSYITIRINSDIKRRLKDAAERSDVSLSTLIEFLAKKFLDTYCEYVEEKTNE